MQMSESEKVIRRLYQITHDYDKGIDHQIAELLQMGLERFNLDIGILSLITEGRYIIQHVVCPDDVPLKAGDEFSYDLSYCWVTVDAGGPVAIENVGESDVLGKHPAYLEFGLESYIGIPIKLAGEVVGTLNFTSPNPYPREFRDIDIDSLKLMATWIEVELTRQQQREELERLNRKLESLVRTDPLTELPNRRFLFEHIGQSLNMLNRRKSQGAVVLVDLDHFKLVNDTYGHQRGDLVLMEVAEVLRNAIRNYDFVGRYGGEEFMLWLQDIELHKVDAVCERIRQGLSKMPLDGITVTASMGVCHFHCENTPSFSAEETIDRIIYLADTAMFDAKHAGRDCYVIYKNTSLAVSQLEALA